MAEALRVISTNSDWFAPRLTELREAKGFSKKDLASKLKVSQGAVTMWEDPDYGAIPKIGNLLKIADLFEMTVEQLCRPPSKKRARR